MTPSVAVVGAGFVGSKHARAVAETPGLELGAVADTDEQRLGRVAGRFDVPGYTDYREALAAVDAAVVATPTATHADVARAVMDRGLPLLLEKPVAGSVEEAAALADLAGESAAPVGVGFLLRCDPEYRYVKDAVAGGDLGTLVSLRARRAFARGKATRTGDRVHPTLDMNVHDVDALCWLADSPVSSVRAVERRGELTGEGLDAPDAVQALLTFESGATAVLEGYTVLPDDVPGGISADLEVLGSEGVASVETPRPSLTVHVDRYDHPDTRHWPVVGDRLDGAIRREADRLAAVVRGDGEFPASLADGVRAQAVAEAVVEATGREGPVTVDYPTGRPVTPEPTDPDGHPPGEEPP